MQSGTKPGHKPLRTFFYILMLLKCCDKPSWSCPFKVAGLRPFPRTHCPNLEINIDGGLVARASCGTAQLLHSNSKRRHSLGLDLMTLLKAWMQHTASHTVTVAMNFGSKMSWGNFFKRGRTSGRLATCEADTK